jgi:hypothetical protein
MAYSTERPTGLSKAHISPPSHPHGPKSPKQDGAYVQSAKGGSLSKLSFGRSDRKAKPPRRGGGRRREIKGFSRASRRRLLRLTASINWDRFQAKAYFLTLTYPDDWPDDPQIWKRNLDTLGKRLGRRYPGRSAIWRMEFQGRGAPHFHLILFLPRPTRDTLGDLRSFVARAWYEVCGSICEEHLNAGTQVRQISSSKRLKHDALYLAKTGEKLGDDVPNPGKTWGVWGRNQIPVHWETVRITIKEAYKLRRILRRLSGLRGSAPLRTLHVFVRYENIVRLLSWMGCYRG